ncbi:hypothetical protein ACYPKM_01085 [Pseudomonas aeruginosa]
MDMTRIKLNIDQAKAVILATQVFSHLATGRFFIVTKMFQDGLLKKYVPEHQLSPQLSDDESIAMLDICLSKAAFFLGFEKGTYPEFYDPERVSNAGRCAYEIQRQLQREVAYIEEPNPQSPTPEHTGIVVSCADQGRPSSHVTDVDGHKVIELIMSMDHAKALVKALDVSSRIGIGQLNIIGEEVRFLLIEPIRKIESEDDRLQMFEDVDHMIQAAKRAGFGFERGASYGIGNENVNTVFHRQYEVKKVLEKVLSEHRDPNPQFRGVNYEGLFLRYTQDPAPEAEVFNDAA